MNEISRFRTIRQINSSNTIYKIFLWIKRAVIVEFKQVRYFLEIANKGSFQLGADSLGLTQPALSQQIGLLERELRVSLFQRSKQGVSLTHKGEIFYNYAIQMLEIWKATEEGMHAEASELTGNITIAAGGTISAWILPKWIKSILKIAPNLTISVIEGDNYETKEYLRTGVVDLAILTSPYKPDKTIISFPILKDNIVPIVQKESTLLNKKNLTISDLENESFVYYHQNSAIRMSIEKSWNRNKIRFRPKILMELRSIDSIINCVEAGLGIGFISSYALNKKIRRLNVPLLFAEREFLIAYKKNARPSVLLLAGKLKTIQDL